jgi:hypothetical protein
VEVDKWIHKVLDLRVKLNPGANPVPLQRGVAVAVRGKACLRRGNVDLEREREIGVPLNRWGKGWGWRPPIFGSSGEGEVEREAALPPLVFPTHKSSASICSFPAGEAMVGECQLKCR